MSASAPTALSLLNSVFGLPAYRGAQEEIVRHVTEGGNCLVLMPTGGGKSLCYQLPSLLREGCGVVVSPLIALMRDQVAGLLEAGVNAAVLNSTLSPQEASDVERRLIAGDLDVLYVAPERLLMPRCLSLLEQAKIALFAIDEAHCVSQWGHDFRPEYIGLSVLAERFPSVPRIALTATADELTRKEIAERLSLVGAPSFVASFDRPNIRYEIVDKQNALNQLKAFIAERHQGEAGIVYCLSRAKVEDVATSLREAGINALPYHAGLDAADALAQPGPLHQRRRHRDRRHHRFRHGHRQAGRALRRPSRPAQEHRGLLPGDRARRPRRQAFERVDGLWPVRHRAAAPHDRRIHRLGRLQARLDRQAGCAGRPGRDRAMPAAPPARLFRRGGA